MDALHIAMGLVAINAVTFSAFFYDKMAARQHAWRIPEMNLLLLCALGGAITGLFAMYFLRHKSRKILFRLAVPLCLVLQLLAGAILALRAAG